MAINAQQRRVPSITSIARATAIAATIAVTINLVLYLVATSVGWLPALSAMGAVTLAPVLLQSVVPVIVGAVLYGILNRFLARSRANQVFLLLSLLVFSAMAFGPITSIIEPSLGTVLILETMHLLVALPTVYFLLKAQ